MRSLYLSALVALLLCSTAVAQPDRPRTSPFADARSAPPADPLLPEGFYVEDAASGATFEIPVGMDFAPDGRIFVAEKDGRVMVVENGQLLPEPFLDLTDEVYSVYDRGLLGVVLDPDFAQNGWVYVVYTVDRDGAGDTEGRRDVFSRVTRYAASSADPNRADPASRHVVLGETFRTGIPACFESHSIGTLAFGSDGTLFVGAGDAASYEEPDAGGLYPDCFGDDRADPAEDIGAYRAQYLGSLAGKVLRVDPETGLGLPSNPFWTGDAADNASRVWALGLRNPFRFTVDTAGGSEDPAAGNPGLLYIADVGWYFWEELNVARGGENFGWPCYEGPELHDWYPNVPPPHSGCEGLTPDPPAAYWSHRDADTSNPPGLEGRSITGGQVYTGTEYPATYDGRLFYADFPLQWMGTAVPVGDTLVQHEVFGRRMGPLVSINLDPSTGLLHWIDIWAGSVSRLRYAGGDANNAPVAAVETGPPYGDGFLTVDFSAEMSYDPDGDSLAYYWDFGDGTDGRASALSHTFPAPGAYAVTLVVSDSAGASARLGREVRVGSAPPAITALWPLAGATVAVGDAVALEAEALDPEGEALTYQWDVRQLHDIHQHPNVFSAEGARALFSLPPHGIPGDYVGYLVRLTVTDPNGIATVAERVVHAEQPHDLPETWHTRDIGGTNVGGASGDGDVFSLTGGGLAPDSTRDYVRFVYQRWEGDGFAAAHVTPPSAGGDAAQAGVMVRAGLRADAAQAFAFVDAQGAIGLRYREQRGQAGGVMPCRATVSTSTPWLRLSRRAAEVTMEASADGEQWLTCATVPFSDAEVIYTGMAVTSNAEGRSASAAFGSVSSPVVPVPPAPSSPALRFERAFPNPARAELTLAVTTPDPGPASLEVFDVLGRRVLLSAFDAAAGQASLVRLDVSGLAPGAYLARVTQGPASGYRRFTVL